MNPLAEIRLIVLRELKKSFRSAKGIVLLILSMLGGGGAALLLVKVQQFKHAKLGDVSADQMHEIREKGLTEVFSDAAMGKYLADAPEVLLAVLMLTIWLTPMLIALLGFDSVSADVQHRSVRYWTMRTRRSSYFVGKFVGLWATVSTITLVMHALIWIVCVARAEATAAVTFSWGVRFWLVSLPISAAWCGLATLVSSFFRTPIVALLVIFASFFVLWLVYVIGGVAEIPALMWAYPNYYDKYLLSPRIESAATGFGVCAAFAALSVGAGSVLFARRDV